MYIGISARHLSQQEAQEAENLENAIWLKSLLATMGAIFFLVTLLVITTLCFRVPPPQSSEVGLKATAVYTNDGRPLPTRFLPQSQRE